MASFQILLFIFFTLLSTIKSQASLASSLKELPSCAVGCFETAIVHSSCSSTNQTCLCTTVSFQTELEQCVGQNCTVKESLTTKNVTTTLCGAPIRNKSSTYRSICVALIVVSGLLVVQRFAFKIYANLDIAPDDWLTLATLLLLIPITVISASLLVENGIGKDIWTLTFHQINDFSMYFFIDVVLYFAHGTLLKCSLLAFYLRIFPEKKVRRMIWATIIVNVLSGVVFFVVTAFLQCKPISYFWTLWDGEHTGECLNRNAIAWTNAGVSILIDIWMLIIPLSQLKMLNLHWKRKIGVAMMFTVGSFFTIVSILRLRSLLKFKSNSKNPTWEYYDAARWSIIEINVGIICSCMPSARLLLTRLFPNVMGSSLSRSYPSERGNKSRSRQTKNRLEDFEPNNIANVELTQYPSPKKGIICQRTFTVESGDTDETRLV